MSMVGEDVLRVGPSHCARAGLPLVDRAEVEGGGEAIAGPEVHQKERHRHCDDPKGENPTEVKNSNQLIGHHRRARVREGDVGGVDEELCDVAGGEEENQHPGGRRAERGDRMGRGGEDVE